ncbi:MAG: hypothetical protein H6677_17820 [Candidatus Obscuribacterales bacterium]|nr:hypothetical protein [Candidatus Obscuribacterales bacterium]
MAELATAREALAESAKRIGTLETEITQIKEAQAAEKEAAADAATRSNTEIETLKQELAQTKENSSKEAETLKPESPS